ncbi:MalY/PatB family protein [uncultured Methanobrevibacter sp.]|uniref:MalY/PatB family protein n=1 Tax=uncultured Methanobrevibacter sp. TaxID=253161 RepID=UPI0026013E24|nr:MalY/PatB family protein [uncultured Methanobrevibacter sp.]
MKYDFDVPFNRKNTNSLKWDLFDVEIPMWVADMDFKVAPEIQKAIQAKVDEGIYGYGLIPDEWYLAYINWWKQYNFNIKKDWLKFTNSVMPSISTIIRELSSENDKILIQTPVYHVFFKVIEDNNRIVEENKLLYSNGEYSIDFEDLEEKFKDEKVKFLILCNPHNPVGKIFSKNDLKRIAKLANKYDKLVVSDEIHCDLTDPSINYTPYASVSKLAENNSITCFSPSKTFNIAGIKTSAVCIPNEKIKKRIFAALDNDGVSDSNIFAITAAIAAYNNGGNWLKELKEYIYNNKIFLKEFLDKEIPEIKLIDSEATYLLWIDCNQLKIKSVEFNRFLMEKTSLLLSPGLQFGVSGEGFLRINIACPRPILENGLNRLKEGILLYKQETKR